MSSFEDFKKMQKEQKRPSFENVMFHIGLLDESSSEERICNALLAAGRLPAVQKHRVFQMVKKATGLSIKVLKDMADDLDGPDNKKPDQHTYAMTVLDRIGPENIIVTTDNTYIWKATGIWRQMDERALKKQVQEILVEIGAKISRGLVDAVAEILKNSAFQQGHRWNQHPEIINFKNGEVMYGNSSWSLKPHSREHYFATQLPHNYEPEADAPRFEQFLSEIFEGDADAADKAQLILELIGYSLVSHSRYEKFVLLVGPGANGKSVIMDTVRSIVGPELAAAVQPSQFSRSFQRAHLHLKLVNLVTEIAEGAVISDAELKSIVSGEAITVENKNKPPFDMQPFVMCWFGANHMPHTRDFSSAFFRRALVIRFSRIFTGTQADPNLREKLYAEIPGIICRSLEAFGKVIERGGQFTEPESCKLAKREWQFEADQAAQFINDCCVPDKEAGIESADLYGAYKSWAQDEGIRNPLKHKTFSTRVERLGFKLSRGTGGVRKIVGLHLRDDTTVELFG